MTPKKKSKKATDDSKSNSEDDSSPDDEEAHEKPAESLGKRKRKSSVETTYEPDDFTMSENSGVKIVAGRGKKLQDFPSVVSSMEKHTTDDIIFAHKFLFGNKGANLKKKELLANLKHFNGYLKKFPRGYDKDKVEADDEREEEKYSKKAFKMIVAQIQMLCDFFDVIRINEKGKPLNKDDMIENMLDFLSQPHKDFLNAGYTPSEVKKPAATKKAKTTKAAPKKKTSTTKKKTGAIKKVKVVKAEVVEEDTLELVKNHEKGISPSDKILRHWVKAYIACFNMDSATTKHAIKTASDKFGIDLSIKKDAIKKMLAEEM